MALRELESAMASETEASLGNTTINYEAALTAVETQVVVAVVARTLTGASHCAAKCQRTKNS